MKDWLCWAAPALLGVACSQARVPLDTHAPDAEDSAPPPLPPQGVLSEILADNDDTNEDEYDEADDWIELANPTDQPLDLGGWSLTDEPEGQEDPWRFPPITVLPPGDFLLVWADGQPEQGDLHLPFKLSSEGEEVVLVDPWGQVADAVPYPELDKDRSWAVDERGIWQRAEPSPGSANFLEE